MPARLVYGYSHNVLDDRRTLVPARLLSLLSISKTGAARPNARDWLSSGSRTIQHGLATTGRVPGASLPVRFKQRRSSWSTIDSVAGKSGSTVIAAVGDWDSLTWRPRRGTVSLMAKALTLNEKLAPFTAGQALLENLARLREALAELDLTDDDSALRRRRTLEVLGLLESSLSTAKTVLLTNTLLDNLVTSVQAVTTHLPYIAPPQETLHFENQLSALTELVRPLTGGAGTERVPAIAGAALAAIAATAQIRESLEKFEQQGADLQEHMSALLALRDSVFEEVQADLDGLIATSKASLETATAAGAERMEADRVSFVRAAQEATEEGEKHLSALKNLLGVASDLTLSTDYGKQADAEAKRAQRMLIWALVAGAGAVVASIAGVLLQAWAASHQWSNYDPWAVLPGKLAVIGALAAIATYLGRQSSNHRRYSEHLRGAQLELRNLGPYLAPLSQEDQERIRGELVANFFGKPGPVIHDDAPTAGASVEQLLQLIQALVKAK